MRIVNDNVEGVIWYFIEGYGPELQGPFVSEEDAKEVLESIEGYHEYLGELI